MMSRTKRTAHRLSELVAIVLTQTVGSSSLVQPLSLEDKAQVGNRRRRSKLIDDGKLELLKKIQKNLEDISI